MIPSRLAGAIHRFGQLPRGSGQVVLKSEDGVLEVLIDNAKRAGAIGPRMMVDLSRLPGELRSHQPAAVVLHSTSPTGRAFCAGGDLASVRAHLMEADAAADMCDLMSWVLDSLAEAPCLVLAAVEGPALGGGAEILTACDHIYAGPEAQVGFVHARLGVSPGWGGGARLLRRVGRREAIWWLTEARAVRASDAQEHGLLEDIVPRGAALGRARAHAARVASLPRTALRAAMALANGDTDQERALFLSLWGGPDHRAALQRSRAGR